jgi:hypothetical protein
MHNYLNENEGSLFVKPGVITIKGLTLASNKAPIVEKHKSPISDKIISLGYDFQVIKQIKARTNTPQEQVAVQPAATPVTPVTPVVTTQPTDAKADVERRIENIFNIVDTLGKELSESGEDLLISVKSLSLEKSLNEPNWAGYTKKGDQRDIDFIKERITNEIEKGKESNRTTRFSKGWGSRRIKRLEEIQIAINNAEPIALGQSTATAIPTDAKADIEKRRQEIIRITDFEKSEPDILDKINAKYDAELAALEQPTAAVAPSVDISKEVILSGLRGGFQGVSYSSFDIRSDVNVMNQIESDKSFSTTVERKGKKYVLVALRIIQDVGARTPGRDGYSFAMIEDNGSLPSNIVDLLKEQAISNISNLYKDIAAIESSVKPIESTTTAGINSITENIPELGGANSQSTLNVLSSLGFDINSELGRTGLGDGDKTPDNINPKTC